MLDFLLILAATEGAEPSKTPFYAAGLLLTLFAVVVGALGVVRHDFPSSKGASRGIIGIGALLVVITMVSSIVTS
jgi:hypothetical protein